MAQAREVVTRVGIGQGTALRFEDGVEAGDEHVEGNAGQQCLVDLFEYLPRRGGVQGSGGQLQHPAGSGHHQCCWHSLARCVSHHDSQPTLRERVEVVEVSSHFPSGSVVGRDLPALQLGHLLRERGMLDAPGYPKLLLDQLALVHLLHEILPYLEVLQKSTMLPEIPSASSLRSGLSASSVLCVASSLSHRVMEMAFRLWRSMKA